MEPRLSVDVLTLFPGMLEGFLGESIVGRARKQGLVRIATADIRDWTSDRHRTADDRPFGGGAGMVLKPEPLAAAIEATRREDSRVIYLCPDGELLQPALCRELAGAGDLVLLSGHYEGIDQRVRETLIDREISIGDYVLTNGTLAAAVLIDAVCRHVPGVLGEEKSLTQDSFNDNLLSFPQFTRPASFRGMDVPEVLLQGDHGAIEQWRQREREEKTRRLRPDLYHRFLQSQSRPT